MSDEDDDEVVAELDVYSCRSLWGHETKVTIFKHQSTDLLNDLTTASKSAVSDVTYDPLVQICLMQYPLRPQWRPYELGEDTTVRNQMSQTKLSSNPRSDAICQAKEANIT